jgi:hypothetical protein
MVIYSEFSQKKWLFSIVMLVYQKVRGTKSEDDDVFFSSGTKKMVNSCDLKLPAI